MSATQTSWSHFRKSDADPVAAFRAFAAGLSDKPVTRAMAQAVVAHINSLIEGVDTRDEMIHSLIDEAVTDSLGGVR